MLLTLLGKLVKVGWFELEDEQAESMDRANGQEAPTMMIQQQENELNSRNFCKFLLQILRGVSDFLFEF